MGKPQDPPVGPMFIVQHRIVEELSEEKPSGKRISQKSAAGCPTAAKIRRAAKKLGLRKKNRKSIPLDEFFNFEGH